MTPFFIYIFNRIPGQWASKLQPIIILFLRHGNYKHQLVRAMRKHIEKFKVQLTPLHWPSLTIVEGVHQQLGDALFNFRRWHQSFLIRDPECTCIAYVDMFPDAARENGHMWWTGDFPITSRTPKPSGSQLKRFFLSSQKTFHSHTGQSADKMESPQQ